MNFKKYHVSKNLFDKSTATHGYYVNDTTGIIATNPTYAQEANASDYIPISGDSISIYSNPTGKWRWGAFYDSNKTFVSGITGYNKTITIPENARYMRLTVVDEILDTLMVNLGSTPLPYEPYSSEVWHDTPYYIHDTSTDTITTLPAVVYPNAATATVGLKGNTVQSTIPTPQNPVMPQGTGERTGNLWDKGVPIYAYAKDYKKYNPDNAIALKAGTYTISSDGILPQIQAFHADLSPYADIQDVIQKDVNMYVGWDNRALLPTASTFKRTTIVIAEDCIITLCCNPTYIGTYIMLNTGSEALPYEPYGYKIPISSANTTTPIYLGEVETTRKVKKVVLTGNESYVKDGNATYLYYVYVSHMYHTNCLCSHLKSTTGYPTTQEGCSTYNNAAIIYLNFGSTVMDAQTSGNTVAGLKEYLATQYANGTPVTVWYVLATPETAVVNEPLMKIGNYTDEVSNVSIPVTAGGDTLSVDTTVQPSEVTVNYKGWHPVADVHERTNGAWT